MVTRSDYSADMVSAARSVLIEVTHLLAAYREHVVLIGGWIPHFLIENSETPHIGSMDVDLALDHRHIEEHGYKTIRQLLTERGYKQGEQPFIFIREIQKGESMIKIHVDLLSGEYQGTSPGHRTQKIGDLRVRKARGCDIAFDMSIPKTITGELPQGGKDVVTLKIASIVPFLVMKIIALAERLKEKDAYDIHFCLKNYPGGIATIAAEFQPRLSNKLVQEGLNKLAVFFESIESSGPKFTADFEDLEPGEERELLKRDSFECVQELLRILNLSSRRIHEK